MAWEREVQNEDDIFYTPLESSIKEDFIGSGSVMSNKGTHLEVNSAQHAYIVKQLTDHFNLFHFVKSLMPKQSKSKSAWKCVEVIKIGDREV